MGQNKFNVKCFLIIVFQLFVLNKMYAKTYYYYLSVF